MARYFARRVMFAVVLLILASMTSFLIIQLPPGDYLTSYIAQLRASGQEIDEARIRGLERQYGLDQPVYVQYWRWISGMPWGDFGFSFAENRPVRALIGERLGYSVMISLLGLLVSYGLAIPIGIYSATHQYSLADYAFTFLGFIGLAVPGFLLALVVVFLAFKFRHLTK
jgi:peptide/nickel transport system permease protein